MTQQQNNDNNGGARSHESDDPPAPSACDQCRNRKVRCDRQLPQCSSCEKAGVLCEFPTRGKRVNPVKQLVEGVSGLAARLDSIDSTIRSLVQQIPTPQRRPSDASNPPSRSETSSTPEAACNDVDDIDLIFSSALDGQDYWSRHAELHKSGPDQEPQTISGTSIGNRALLEKVRQAVHNLLEGKRSRKPSPDSSSSDTNNVSTSPMLLAKAHPSTLSELKAIYDTFPTFDDAGALSLLPGGQYVSLPPQSILETSLQLFLDKFNAVTPIFNETCLREAINARYGSRPYSKTDEAYNLCFNNIIVLSSGLRARLARLDKSYPKGMNEELLPAFLANSFRALRHLKFFLQPRHVNLQALATLALVAREYHESCVFDMICHMACDLFKAMDSEQSPISKAGHPSFEEWRTLYWTLFVMDKQRTSVNGLPFDLYFYDSDLPLSPEGGTRSLGQQSWMMHIYITTIWEETYISLYSARAARKGSSYRESQITRLDKLAEKWHSRTLQLFPESTTDNDNNNNLFVEDNWQVELKYAYHIGQVLIHSRSDTANSREIELRNAKAALQIINGVLNQTPTEGSLTLLCRLLRSYPLIAVHSICMRFFENPSIHMLEDLDLIDGVRDAFRILVDPNIPICSTGKTYMGISWCLEVAQAFRKILFEVSTPCSSSEHHQLGVSRKRPQDGLPLPSQHNQSPLKRMKLSLTDSGQTDYSNLSDFPVDKNHSSDPLERHNLSMMTSTEELINLGHLINQQQQQHHIFPSGLSGLPHIDSSSNSTEELSLVTDSIPTLSLDTKPTPNYPTTLFPSPQPPQRPPGSVQLEGSHHPSTTTVAVAAAAPMMFYAGPDDPASDLHNQNSINNVLACDNFLQLEDHDIENHYMPDDISRWLLQLAHREDTKLMLN
ncbi:putative C6 transcription factor [Talaromyces proteolyticus]|uniref:C6 transcription factor n=1 Tax=Talaromyces proteolyticus TaxID=1131652 RepID=A0AAD4KLG6_9EURO|nr:putative C6 transcription factor [Talaromyces proteolyticus]KAH8691212.1 putative C6 transcription factor [Talaromyces proteolyticus]